MGTKAEEEHLQAVAELGCVVCRNLGYGPSPAQIHHVRDGQGMGQRADNFSVIPLCPQHHQHGNYGVAFHAGPEIWQERYGTERDLLKQVQAELGISNST